MHIELIEMLRCPTPHGASWLVGRFDRTAGRDIVEGVLGCPACRAEYPIRAGVVLFDQRSEAGSGITGGARDEPAAAGPEEAMRLAAMLGLVEPGGVVLLAGRWARLAGPLEALSSVPVLLLNPPADALASGGSAIVSRRVIPVAPGALRAVALDPGTVDAGLLDSAAAALQPGGRLVVPRGTEALPAGLVEVARDERHVVAEAPPETPVIPLRRR